MTAPAAAPRRKSRLGTWIAGAMIVGIATGHLVHVLSPDAATTKTIAGYFSLLTDIFLRLIKMVIAPLVFSTLVAGMAGHKEGGTGRVGMKAMCWLARRLPMARTTSCCSPAMARRCASRKTMCARWVAPRAVCAAYALPMRRA